MDRQDQKAWKIIRAVTNPKSVTINDLYIESQLVSKFKMWKYSCTNKLLDNDFICVQSNQKKDTKALRDYPFS
jgi:hypothetical protein